MGSRASLAVSAALSLLASACGDGRAGEDDANSVPRCEYTERIVGVEDRSLGFSAADVLKATSQTQTCSWIWYDPYPFGTMMPQPGVTSAEVSLGLGANEATLLQPVDDGETVRDCGSSMRVLGALQIATDDGAIEHTFSVPLRVSAPGGDFDANVDISGIRLPDFGFSWEASWEKREEPLLIASYGELWGGLLLVQGSSSEYPDSVLGELFAFECEFGRN